VAKFFFTQNYENCLVRIEDYILFAAKSLDSVQSFLELHDKALAFIGKNPKTPPFHSMTGDQSWNFGDGRYRIFFRYVEGQKELIIYLIHLIDNKEINLDIYPNNKIPTYDEE